MKIAMLTLVTGVVAVIAGISVAPAQLGGGHKLLPAQEIEWASGPASLPAGAQAAVLYGDPGKDGLFAMRLKLPKDYRVAPHTHPRPEIVTLISGTARLELGVTADPTTAKVLPAGSTFILSPDAPHYISVDEETVVQLNSTGPWGLSYLNPKDDPRQKTR